MDVSRTVDQMNRVATMLRASDEGATWLGTILGTDGPVADDFSKLVRVFPDSDEARSLETVRDAAHTVFMYGQGVDQPAEFGLRTVRYNMDMRNLDVYRGLSGLESLGRHEAPYLDLDLGRLYAAQTQTRDGALALGRQLADDHPDVIGNWLNGLGGALNDVRA